MTRTPNQDKALAWYVNEYNLKPILSAHPTYYFIDASGKEITVSMQIMLREWENWRKRK